MDVAKWALEHELPVMELYPSVISEVEPHIKDDATARDEFIAHHQELERPQTLLAIENAFIRDVVGIVELPSSQICYEGNWWLPNLLEHPAYQRRMFFKKRRLSGNWYSLLSKWATEYYHWFHDVLPRLENALSHLPGDTRFLINESPSNYQLESLKAYGITASQLESQAVGVRTKVERLWFATPVGHENLGSGKVISRVAGRLKKYFVPDGPAAQPRKIFISRKKATCRRVIDESECEPILKELGFEIMMLEDIAWHEQVRLFSAAEAIMGPHGAGLMNMIFALDRAAIWEIVPKVASPHYIVLARQLGYQFQRIYAEPVSDKLIVNMTPGDKLMADMRLRGSLGLMTLKDYSGIH